MPTYQEFPEHCGDRHIPFGHRGDLFPLASRCADACDDQLPLFSQVGRGLQGDGYKVEKFIDEENQTVLRGLIIDPHTGNETEDWRTGNINGGKLTYRINYFPTTDPKTYTITFTLDRPDDPDRGWTFTTPMMPWVWTDEADLPLGGVATLFTKPEGGSTWTEKLVYPDGHTRDEYNAPDQGEPWTVNLTYGKGGDIDCPTAAEEVADIDAAKTELLTHLHKDLFGGTSGTGSDWSRIPDSLKPLMGDTNGQATVWDWIEYAITQATFDPTTLEQLINQTKTDLLTHLHKDLFGGTSGTGSDYSKIPNSLKPLMGDTNGQATVWDWIEHAINSAIQPVLNPSIYTTTLGGDSNTYWLVSFKPTVSPSRAITTSQITNWIAAIPIVVEVEYFDVLPTVYVNMTTKTTDGIIRSGNSIYGGTDNIRLGTGEIAVVCTKSGSGSSSVFTPVNLKNLTLFPSRPEGYQKMKYPPVNPEVLVNGGFGQIAQGSNLVAAAQNTWSLADYPGETFSTIDLVAQHYFNSSDATLAAMGAWAVYAGIGNVKSSNNLDSRTGGYPWVGEDSTTGGSDFFAYIFNRSTGNIGVRVRIDNGRTYSLSFSQAVTVEND